MLRVGDHRSGGLQSPVELPESGDYVILPGLGPLERLPGLEDLDHDPGDRTDEAAFPAIEFKVLF